MTKVYDGRWLDLVLITAPGGSGRHREIWASMPTHTGSYIVRHNDGTEDYVIDDWNQNTVWETSWAKQADQIHTAYLDGDKSLVLELIAIARTDQSDFAQKKQKALAVYEKWAD